MLMHFKPALLICVNTPPSPSREGRSYSRHYKHLADIFRYMKLTLSIDIQFISKHKKNKLYEK